ncbi:DNA gyrase inhibitor YacG [Azospirillum agricola]|uniref:DNA gyrase inhibitor YacG n=1 Tax=Azospirillum agricola TaxID=1720247 RepID=UPI000A0F23FB|nr:DNA gyrase inhibitor YacG [Azospirillum agricola]SMH33551.1 hypothetical protein SAMN02982994_0674 [Azospirillum lipoferum]
MNAKATTSAKPCPVCGRPPDPASRPFCSQRCADVDLGRWLGGVYRIETNETPQPPSASSTED